MSDAFVDLANDLLRPQGRELVRNPASSESQHYPYIVRDRAGWQLVRKVWDLTEFLAELRVRAGHVKAEAAAASSDDQNGSALTAETDRSPSKLHAVPPQSGSGK